jgi:nitrate reductase cytochrome c-type subunit
MEALLLGLAVLACPVAMGLMMWMMMRGRGASTDNGERQQLEQLRAEIDELKAERGARHDERLRSCPPGLPHSSRGYLCRSEGTVTR